MNLNQNRWKQLWAKNIKKERLLDQKPPRGAVRAMPFEIANI